MAAIRKRSITPCPHEAALAEDKSHTQQDPFQSRYAIASRANQRKPPRVRLKLVGVQIEKAKGRHEMDHGHGKI
jgi:hypothetical protein